MWTWPLPRMLAAALAVAVATASHAQDCGPVFSATGPEASLYGADDNYPLGTHATRNRPNHMVASFTGFDRLFPVRNVPAGPTATPLMRSCNALNVSYKFDGQPRTLDDYIGRHPVTGLLIAKGSTILYERYQYGRKDTDRFTSQSMAKTIMAMLLGIALDEGKIRSLDDKAEDYVPALKGSAYGATPLRALLTMSSGVTFTEDYLGQDDGTKLSIALRRSSSPGAAALLAAYNDRTVPAGTRFAYASSESQVLALVLTAATATPLADYASQKLWSKIGPEADAAWALDGKGVEIGSCCFNARLRDYARLALVLAEGGRGIIPSHWLNEATRVPPGSYLAPRKATRFYGYGYQTWLFPGPRHMFALLGIHGQAIFVDPVARLVLVHTAVRVKPRDPTARELTNLWYALVRDLGKP